MQSVTSVSIVSHGHLSLVKLLLDDIQRFCKDDVAVILTINLPEKIPADFSRYTFPLQIIENAHPRGFAANHNAAFRLEARPFFCVLNPDVRLLNNPFPLLIPYLQQKNCGVVAPLVVDALGHVQDNARQFPTILTLLRRVFFKKREPDYDLQQEVITPDWVGGMFMLFSHEVYQLFHGFDEKYYLYCEDMDLCANLRKRHYQVLLIPGVKVIHEARRASHSKLQYMIWHCQSLARFFYRWYSGKYETI